jgi:hypothetical protein
MEESMARIVFEFDIEAPPDRIVEALDRGSGASPAGGPVT